MVIPPQLAFRAPLLVLGLCLLAGLLILLLGNWQTRQLANQESDRLGQALAAQLAETTRQPLLHNDLVSLQVNVERLVEHAAVAGAAVYNAQQKPLAQSDNASANLPSDLSSYREPVVVEGRTIAHAGVDIDSAVLLSRYRTPIHWVLAIWLVFSAALVTLVTLTARNHAQRLQRLFLRLPSDDSHQEPSQEPSQAPDQDELTQLEQRLEPLLTQQIADTVEQPNQKQVATVALHCKNLERLEAQLSRENLQRLLNQLDDDLEQICTLYQGQRQPGRDHTLFLEFDGEHDNGDHPLRALFAAYLLLELAASHAQSLGVGLELSAAARLSQTQSNATLLNDFEREKRETEVLRLARLGERGELLLDSSTRLHPLMESTVTTELVSESSDIHRVEGFAPKQTALLEKQLNYLRSH